MCVLTLFLFYYSCQRTFTTFTWDLNIFIWLMIEFYGANCSISHHKLSLLLCWNAGFPLISDITSYYIYFYFVFPSIKHCSEYCCPDCKVKSNIITQCDSFRCCLCYTSFFQSYSLEIPSSEYKKKNNKIQTL